MREKRSITFADRVGRLAKKKAYLVFGTLYMLTLIGVLFAGSYRASRKLIYNLGSQANAGWLRVFGYTSIIDTIIFGLIFIGLAAYAWIDYRSHRKPLVDESPGVKYSFTHHVKVVSIPLIQYRWKAYAYNFGALLVGTAIIAVSLFTVISGVFAAVPVVTTSTAGTITTTSAVLNGSVESSDQPVTSRGFELGETTSYGQTVSESVSATTTFDNTFTSPSGSARAIAIDNNGFVYVTLDNDQKVQKLDSSGALLAEWGSFGTGLGEFTYPRGIAADSNGYIYVSDTTGRIQKIDTTTGTATLFASGLGSLQGVAVDTSGSVYVVETSANRIAKFQSDGTPVATYGTTGSGDGQLNSPQYIAVDSGGYMYITELSNERVQVLKPDGTYDHKWGTGSIGSGDGQFCYPEGIALDLSNNVYVADYCNYRVQKFTSSGTFLGKWGDQGSGDNQFQNPQGLALDGSNRVYVADSSLNVVKRFIPGSSLGAFALSTSGAGELTCNTTYHFRAFATSNDGTAYGDDASFTTAACGGGGGGTTVPSVPQSLTINTHSSTYLIVTWLPPADDGGGSIDHYVIDYKKHSDGGWTEWNNNYQTDGPGTQVIGALDPNTSYDVRVAAVNGVGQGAYASVTGSTVVAGANHTISSCVDLQNMGDDLSGHYTLGQDIDCSATSDVDWFYPGNVSGFVPVGFCCSDDGFTGTLDGAGHKITNLHIDAYGEAGTRQVAGLFYLTTGATIENLRLENATIFTGGVDGGSIVGGLVAHAVDTTLQNVSTSGTISMTRNSTDTHVIMLGGLVGWADGGNTITKAYSSMDIVTDIDNRGSPSIGGLVGTSFTTADVEFTIHLSDTYYLGTITANGNSTDTFGVGGIISALYLGSVSNSYSAGQISYESYGTRVAGGLIATAGGSTVSNNFSVTSVPDSVGDLNGAGSGGLISAVVEMSGGSLPTSTVTNNFYDPTQSGQSTCFYYVVDSVVGAPPSGSCTAVTNPDYFKDNSSNPPLDTWDFGTVWYSHLNGYPTFEPSAALPTVTTNPASSITKISAQLNGTINDGGEHTVTSRGFQFGTTTSYGQTLSETLGNTLTFSHEWGSAGSGDGEFGGSYGMVTDSTGALYTLDVTHQRIEKFTSDGDFIRSINLSCQTPQCAGASVAVDGGDNILVSILDADSVEGIYSRIERYDSDGNLLDVFGDTGPTEDRLRAPYGIAVNKQTGDIYVADHAGGDADPTPYAQIRHYNANGELQGSIGSLGTGPGQLQLVTGLAIDSAGNIYGVDMQQSRVTVFSYNGSFVRQWGSSGVGNGQFGGPFGVYIDDTDLIYVTDFANNRVQLFDTDGTYLSQISYPAPSAVAGDLAGNIFVFNFTDNKVGKFSYAFSAGDFMALRSSLTCNTTYHFRAFATNSDGTGYGVDHSFTTSACDQITPTPTPPNPLPTTPPKPTTTRNPGFPVVPAAISTPTLPESRQLPNLLQQAKPAKFVKAKFRKQPPTIFNLSPYVFISLLLLLALFYAVQSLRDYQAQRSMRETVERIKKVSKATSQYLDICMHYLTTPLAILKGAHELLTSKQALPADFLLSLQNKITGLEQSVNSTIQDNQQVLAAQTNQVQAGIVQQPKHSFKQFWVWVLGLAILIAGLDLYLTFSGAYTFPGGRALNHALWFGLATVLALMSYLVWRRRHELHLTLKQLHDTEENLVQQKSHLLNVTAEQISDHARQLRQGTEGMEQLPDARMLLNGMTMLDQLAVSLNKAQFFASLPASAPIIALGSFYQQHVLPEIQQKAEAKQIALSAQIDPQASIQMTSPELQQVLVSILDNAVEFSGQKGVVELKAAQQHGKTRITVSDHGEGMSDEVVRNLFEPLSRGTSAETFNHKGLGLNMFVNKMIVENHGGTMSVSSHPGQGTTVAIMLPPIDKQAVGMAENSVSPQAATIFSAR